MDDNDWDLYAVVRSCSAVSAAAVPDPFSSFVPLPLLEEENREEAKGLEMIGFPDLTATASTTQHELDELCRPFFVKSNQQTKSQQQQEPQPMLAPKYAYAPLPSSSYFSHAASVFPPLAAAPYQFRPQPRPSQRPIAQTPRSKRRKNQQKKVVCQVPADGISTDLWAWRKYGQKPIKGSPYPRGYYRCSSSKGCQARKQVERSLDEPGMLVITYSAEHNHPIPTHRNSLSGSTRQKFPPLNTSAPPPLAEEGEARPLSSPPAAEPRRVQAGEEDEVEEDEGEEEEDVLLTVADVGMLGEDDMLFMGMEVIDGSTMTTISRVNKSPATVSVSSAFFEEEGSFDDDFLRSPNWVGENNMAAANERDSSSS